MPRSSVLMESARRARRKETDKERSRKKMYI
jgi:hypothetical protein